VTYEHMKLMLKTFIEAEVKTRAEPVRRQFAELLRNLAADIDPDPKKEPRAQED